MEDKTSEKGSDVAGHSAGGYWEVPQDGHLSLRQLHGVKDTMTSYMMMGGRENQAFNFLALKQNLWNLFYFETGSSCIVQASLKLSVSTP